MAKKYGVKIDNREIEVKDGFVLKEELNETLDSGTIQFLSEGGESNIDPFDSVVFEGTKIARKKLLVDTFNAEIENFNSTLETSDYLYTINLFSETKLLERITLPNLAITKRPDGTIVSVWDKIKEYCKRYLPYIKIYDNANKYKYKASLRYDEALESKFNMECPEFVWNTPTLKEVLMDLFSVADCIPVIKDNVLTFFDLTYKGNPIDTTKLTNKTISKTSADYCDSLTLPMKNIISKQPVVVKEHLLPHSTGGEMTSNNACYITRKPIYKIRKCILYLYRKQSAYKHLVEIDITNSVVEKKKFDTLSNDINVLGGTMYNNKCCNLFYNRGGNTIENIGIGYKRKIGGFLIAETHSAYAWIGYAYSRGSVEGFEAYGFDHPFIELEYETIEETTVNVSKTQEVKNKQNALFDSQSANSVDLEHQTLFEYAKANRLSSKIEQIEGTYENESDIPALGDYIGNKILFSKEVQHYDDIYVFRGQLCENYILRNYFTGITSKRRSWNIVDTNEAVLRQDYYKLFILFSTLPLYDDKTFQPYSLSNFNREIFENIYTDDEGIYEVALITTKDKDNTKYPSGTNNFAINDLMQFETGNSLIFSLQQSDNYSFSDKILKQDSIYVMDPTPSADSNGEATQYTIRLCNKIDELKPIGIHFDETIEELLDPATFDKDLYDDVLAQLRNNPIIDGGFYYGFEYFDLIANFTKDNREIVGSSVQFEYLSADEKVIVNDDVASLFAVSKKKLYADEDIGVMAVSNHHYKIGDTEPLGIDIDDFVFIVNTYGSNGYVYDLELNIGENDAFCIYSKTTGKILIAVNGTNRFFCNLLYTRDLNVYNSQIDKVAIGNYNLTQAQLDTNYNNQKPEVESVKVLNRTIDIFDTKDFNIEEYIITFKNWNGEILQTKLVEPGELPTYTGATPTKQETYFDTYTFAGWTPTIAPATENKTYNATFTATKRGESPVLRGISYLDEYSWNIDINNDNDEDMNLIVIYSDGILRFSIPANSFIQITEQDEDLTTSMKEYFESGTLNDEVYCYFEHEDGSVSDSTTILEAQV